MELLSTERNVHLNKTCFSLIFTSAECNHLHARWREGSKSKTLPPRLQEEWPKHQRFLKEVDIKVAPFDVIFDVETFLPFIKMMARPMNMKMPEMAFSSVNSQQPSPEEPVWGMELNNNTLPLFYLKARTIRIFLPTHKNPDNLSQLDSDFVLCHCESMSLSPIVDNPVSRILVKPEVYHLSQQILDVPGSQVENRQYQFDLKGIGLFTGKHLSRKVHS